MLQSSFLLAIWKRGDAYYKNIKNILFSKYMAPHTPPHHLSKNVCQQTLPLYWKLEFYPLYLCIY